MTLRAASFLASAHRVLLHVGAPLLLTVLALVTTVPPSDDPPRDTLQARLSEILSNDAATSGYWSVHVIDLETGRTVYTHDGAKPLVPASTQKILTTALALDVLGPDHRYETTLYFDGSIRGTTMRGDLILRGTGDPSFGSQELGRGGDPLVQWARELAQTGVTRIEGRIIGDDDAFDNNPYAEGWDIDYLTRQASRALGVSAGALSYHDNVVSLQIRSTSSGARTQVVTEPPGYLDIDNTSVTSSRRRGIRTDVDRILGTETVRITGSVPRSYRGPIEMPVLNPTRFTLHAFAHYLRNAGIEVDAELVDVDDLEGRPSYSSAELLMTHFSPPLAELARLINKESNNFYAEQVFRSITATGSASGTRRRVRSFFDGIGAPSSHVEVYDGSGLSRKNLIPAEVQARLLAHMYQHPARDAFVESLARGGEDETTLEYRLQGIPVRAKTGSLKYVRSLSGYATTSDGRPLAFAILANNYTSPSHRIRRTMDSLVVALTTADLGV